MSNPFKSWLWEWRGAAIAAPSITILVLLVRGLGLLQTWEWAAFDQYMRWRPAEPVDARIAIVGIDEEDVKAFNQVVFSDEIYAQLLNKLKAQGPRAIGLDIYRNLPQDPGHDQLLEVFNSTPNLVGIQKVKGDAELEGIDPPPTLKELGQVGANNWVIDGDNRVRRGFVSLDTPDGETVYSFGLYLALLYLQEEGLGPEMLEGTDQWWQLGQALFQPLGPDDGSYVRTDVGGYQILLNYLGPSRTFETVSLRKVLDDDFPEDWAENRIILIGNVGETFKDFFFTPHSSRFLDLPEPMAGVEIHANLISQILSAALTNRPFIRSWVDPLEWAWVLLWAGLGAAFIWQQRHAKSIRQGGIRRVAGFIILALLLLGSTYGLFIWGWWVPVVPPAIALAGTSITITAFIARSAGQIRKTFGRYLSDEIVANLLESPDGLSLGGERREITILTSDLRGFTAVAERLPPEEVIKVINHYLGHMADVITQYQGTIDEFMGDGILVLFGAPTKRPDDAQRSVACAVAMQMAMEKVNRQMAVWGLQPLEMGIGIHTGEVVVGNIGSEKRTKYGVMGSQVNLVYRIESYTLGGQILMTEATRRQVGEGIQVNGSKEVTPKGVQQPLRIYDVAGIGAPYNLALSQTEEVYLPLSDPIPVKYAILDGKHVGSDLTSGYLVQLSAQGALLKVAPDQTNTLIPAFTDHELDVLTNLKLTLWANDLGHGDGANGDGANGDGGVGQSVYAKVIERPANTGSFYLSFTAKPPDIAARLADLYASLQDLGL